MTYVSALKTSLENPRWIPQAWCAEPNIIASQQAIGQIPNNIEAVFVNLTTNYDGLYVYHENNNAKPGAK